MERSKSFDVIYARLLEVSGAKNDSELSRILNLTPQSINGARKRGEIPPGWIQSYAEMSGVSSDWLFFGRGPMRPGQPDSTAPAEPTKREQLNAPPIPREYCINLQILFEVDEAFEEVLQDRKTTLPPTVRAEILCQLCRLVIENEDENRRPAQVFRLIRGALAGNG